MEVKYGLIYMATSRTSCKSYIGQTIQLLPQRKKGHKKDSTLKDTHFCRAIRKYGWEDFDWEILADKVKECDLGIYERKFIEMYDTTNSGYNSTPGGKSLRGKEHPMYGRNHSDDAKEKISEKNKGKLAGDKNPNYGNKNGVGITWNPMDNEETRKKVSLAVKKFYEDENERKKQSKRTRGKKNGMYGKKHTEDARRKMREAHKRRKNTK